MEQTKLTWTTQRRKVNDLVPMDTNPRKISEAKRMKLIESLQKFNLVDLPVIDTDNTVVSGHQRLRALQAIGRGDEEIEVRMPNRHLTDQELKQYNLLANSHFGEWDSELLEEFTMDMDLGEWGLSMDDFNLPDSKENIDDKTMGKKDSAPLIDSFIIPPYSILDTRQGYWMERKQKWRELINDNGESREGGLYRLNGKDPVSIKLAAQNNGVSLLDPVLAEVLIHWFALPKCKIFDPFAGDTVFGYLAGATGNYFTGIELRQEQADHNRERTKTFNCTYICDDAQNIDHHIENDSQDFLFSCPPYFDLEVYSDLPNDASNQSDYPSFLKILENAFSKSVMKLKENRFAAIVVGDIRGKKGEYLRFPDDIKNIFLKSGCILLNELILVNTIGTAALRMGPQMRSRKVVKTHQNVLIFYKGNPIEIKNIYPDLKEEYESADVQSPILD